MKKNNKKVILIHSVGNSDIEQDGVGNLNQFRNDYRERTKHLLDNIEPIKNNFRFPILSSWIELIAKEHKRIDHVYLLPTNQQDETHNKQDTIHAAHIIQKSQLFDSVGNIELLEIGTNPADYDIQYNIQSIDTISKIRAKFKDELKDCIVYINMTSGTPAAVFANIIRAIEMLDAAEIRPVYRHHLDNTSAVLDIAKDIKNNIISKDILEVADLYEYKVAYKLIDDKLVLDNQNNRDVLLELCAYAHARTNMDYDKADKHLIKLLNSKYSKEINTIITLSSNKIIDCYYNAIINYDKGEYIDFLSRLYTYVEVVLREHCLRHEDIRGLLKPGTEEIDKNKLKRLPEIYQLYADKINNKAIYLEWGIMERIITLDRYKVDNKVIKGLNILQKLRHRRNNNTHNLQGISRQDIINCLPLVDMSQNTNLDDRLKYYMSDIADGIDGIPKQLRDKINNPYNHINSVLREILLDSGCIKE